MAAAVESVALPSIPSEWSGENNFRALGKLTQATPRNIEPVGAQFLAEARRKRHKRTFSEDERIQAQESVKKTEGSEDGDLDEYEDPMMLARDAKDWKGQDHYAVLGLSRYRYRATDEQLKRAHRKKVLKHHPDKRAASGSTEDDSFFKCIQKATEILTDPVKRRQFDSVDAVAALAEEPPSKRDTKEGNFYKLWSPVFTAWSRFSNKQPVPKLGNDKSTKEEVERFYDFWFNFDSWRSFEYLNEDVPDDNEHRDQRRQMEKKNANARRKRKTEDNKKLQDVVTQCLDLDDRIRRFKVQEKEQKNKKKNEFAAEEKRKAEATKKKAEEDAKIAQEKEAQEKAQKAEDKKTKEAAKTAVKKNKRTVRTAVKDANYFATGNADAAQIDKVLNETDLLLAKVDPDELAALVEKLSVAPKEPATVHGVFEDEMTRLVGAGKMKESEAKSLRL